MTLLTRASIISAADLRTEVIEVPEWGGAVTIRTMTGVDRDAYEASSIITDGNGKRRVDMTNMRAKLVALTVVDDAGAPMFTLRDVDAIGAKSAAALDRIFRAAQRLNGLGADDVVAAEKNSGPGASAGSTSG